MRKCFLMFTSLVICTAAAFAQHTLSLKGSASPKASLESVAWIAGHWRGEAFGGIAEEVWTPPLGDSMMGSFKLVKDGQVGFYEILAIIEENETLVLRLKHFHGNLRGWEEKDETIDFPLVKITPGKVYFDGMTFEKTSGDAIRVYVRLGQENGLPEEAGFEYKRFKE